MNVIGLDISKDTIDVCLDPTKGDKSYLKIENSINGCRVLQDWIKTKKVRKFLVAMEATGIYYEQAADYLSRHAPVYVINPLKIKEYAKSVFCHTKTDRADSALIADYAKRHSDRLNTYTIPHDRQLQRLINLQLQLKEQIKQAKNRLHASQDDFIADTHKAIICFLDAKLDQTASELDSLIKQQNALTRHFENIKTIPAIGKETALMLLHHLMAKPFQTANKFISFAGLSPNIEQSGTSVDRKRKNKYGHKKLKQSLFMPALVAFRMGAFPQFVKNLQESGKPKMVIIVAIMRKLAKLAYYIFKSGQPYDKSRHQAASHN